MTVKIRPLQEIALAMLTKRASLGTVRKDQSGCTSRLYLEELIEMAIDERFIEVFGVSIREQLKLIKQSCAPSQSVRGEASAREELGRAAHSLAQGGTARKFDRRKW